MYDNYKHLRLNQAVIVGSHDAAITTGKDNVQTQNLNIYKQAEAGVRIFDIRITAFVAPKDKESPSKEKKHRLHAYHGHGITQTQPSTHELTQESVDLDVTRLLVGSAGMSLQTILGQARDFVTDKPTEFVILKFGKCHNYPTIAKTCQVVVGDRLYSERCFLNMTTLGDLAGTVIVLFPHECDVLRNPEANHGILGWENLYEKRSTWDKVTFKKKAGPLTVNTSFEGLQYYGKGGTSLLPRFKNNKIHKNAQRQTELMLKASSQKKVVGMMYWTTTGIFADINKRNDRMWSKEKHKYLFITNIGLREMWDPLIAEISQGLGVTGETLQECIPNIVMIDFAKTERCKTIVDLNKAFTDDEAESLQASVAEAGDADNGDPWAIEEVER